MSRISDLAEAFRFVRRQQGWRPAVSMAVQFVRAPFFEFHRGFVLRKPLEGPIDVPAPSVPVDIRQVTPDDGAVLGTIVPPLRVRRLTRKMESGEVGCIAVRERQAIAFVFAGFGNTPSTRATSLELGPGEAYLWSGYVLPEYRRQGVVRAVNLYLCRLLQERGYETTVLQVDAGNRASLGHCYKMGYQVTERVTFLKILGWRMRRCVTT